MRDGERTPVCVDAVYLDPLTAQRYAVASGDADPVFFDPAAAAATAYGGLIVPPTWPAAVKSWEPGPPAHELTRDGRLADEDHFFSDAGAYPRQVRGEETIEFFTPLRPGMTLQRATYVGDVRFREGRSGPLALVDVCYEFTLPDGAPAMRVTTTFVRRPA